MSTDTTFRAMHDVGLAAWFGGSVFGIAGLNAAAEEAPDQHVTDVVESIGWAKWSPVAAVAVGTHLVGGAGLLLANRKRAAAQKGAGATATAKLVVTGAALAATAYSRVLGKKIEDAVVHANPRVGSSTTSQADSSTTRQGASSGSGEALKEADKTAGRAVSGVAERLPLDVRRAKVQLRYVQFLIPALTGTAIVLGAQAGEEQRPGEQLRGIARRAGSVVGLEV